ncbi:hypothetical protein EMGBS4_15300, partial [Acidimicrobiaceae bacterium]
CLGAAAAVFGINYMKKKVEDDSEAFSSENIADTMTDLVGALKNMSLRCGKVSLRARVWMTRNSQRF